MRVGLVGAGRIGVLHAGTLTDDPRVAGLVVADVDNGRARQLADKVGAEVAAVDELFDGHADAVVIAAATSAHAELVHRALDAGIPVFCEKPLAADVPGTREVLVHASAGGGSLYIATSGGIFRDCFIHDFDSLRFVTGREVVSVFAVGGNKGADFFASAGDVDTATVTLLLDDGTVATVLGGRYNGAGYDVRFEVHGSRAMIAVGLDEQAPLRSAERGVAWPDGRPYASFFERFQAAYATELADFVAHALGRIPNPCPPEDALAATELGPDGFLPGDPPAWAGLLDAYGLHAVGGFVPLVLHDPGRDVAGTVAPVLDAFSAAGASTLVLAAATGLDGYDGRVHLDDDQWRVLLANLDRVHDTATERGITATLHPHVGTIVEGPQEVARVLEGSSIALCLDTGHLIVGGSHPARLAAAVPERIGHVHLKDVDAWLAAQIRSGTLTYTEAVKAGLYRPLGTGDVDVAAIVRVLESAGYQGWYVMEQDTVLDHEPAPGKGPSAAVRASLTFLRELAP